MVFAAAVMGPVVLADHKPQVATLIIFQFFVFSFITGLG